MPPANGATMKSHKPARGVTLHSRSAATRAGPILRAGFTEVPVMGMLTR